MFSSSMKQKLVWHIILPNRICDVVTVPNNLEDGPKSFIVYKSYYKPCRVGNLTTNTEQGYNPEQLSKTWTVNLYGTRIIQLFCSIQKRISFNVPRGQVRDKRRQTWGECLNVCSFWYRDWVVKFRLCFSLIQCYSMELNSTYGFKFQLFVHYLFSDHGIWLKLLTLQAYIQFSKRY